MSDIEETRDKAEAYLSEIAPDYEPVTDYGLNESALSTDNSEGVSGNLAADLKDDNKQYQAFTIQFYEDSEPDVHVHKEAPIDISAEDIRNNLLE